MNLLPTYPAGPKLIPIARYCLNLTRLAPDLISISAVIFPGGIIVMSFQEPTAQKVWESERRVASVMVKSHD